jgi:hypothetical protein
MPGVNPLQGLQSGAPMVLWHLCWQAAVGRDFFVHPSLPGRIRERLIQAHNCRGRVLVDYVLLPTEIHVLAQLQPDEAAGDVARAIGNVVSRWVRQAQPVRSPVLAGPHLAHRLASVAELRTDIRMLAWRPVYLGVCHTPSHHPHGALRIALGLTPVQGFDSRWLLCLFGDTVPQARETLRGWVSRRPSEQAWREWELTRGLSLAMGSAGPQPHMAREVRSAGAAALVAAGCDGIDGALGLLELWVALKIGLPAAADLRAGGDGASARGRALVACLAVRHQLCSAASVARYFGRAKATLSEQMTACKARTSDRPIIATPVRRIVDEAHALASDRVKASRQPQPGSC